MFILSMNQQESLTKNQFIEVEHGRAATAKYETERSLVATLF